MNKERKKIIKDIIKEENIQALFLEPEFDDALIGTCKTYGTPTVAAYDTDKCIKILMSKFKLDEVDAYERFTDSIHAIAKGENKPFFINDFRNIYIPKEEDIDKDKKLEDNQFFYTF